MHWLQRLFIGKPAIKQNELVLFEGQDLVLVKGLSLFRATIVKFNDNDTFLVRKPDNTTVNFCGIGQVLCAF